jgi:protein phosphatase
MKLFDRIFGPHTPPSVDASKKIFGILHEQTENPVDPLAQQGRFQVRAAEKPQEKIKTTDDLLVEFKKKFPNGASSNGLSAFFHEVYDSGRVDSDTWGKDYAEVYDGLFKLFILYQLEDNGLNAYRAKQLSTQTPVEEQTTPLEVSVEKKEEETSIKVGMFSLASEGHPEHNEDKAFANITTRSFGVFDGMGGVDGGEKAASLACDFVRDQSAYLEVDDTVLQAKENLEYCMHEANTIVFTDPYQENKKPEHRMGTTGCLARIVEDENKEKKLVVASVADSRTYVFRSTGELECITLDNGVGEEGVGGDFTSKAEKMALQKKFSNAVSTDGFSDFEKFKWNRRNVVGGALGIFQTTTFGMYETTINDGDVVLLTSDGIHDNLTEDEIKKYIQNALASGSSPEMISMQLAQKAQERSREADPNDPGEAHFRAKRCSSTK